MRSGCYALGVIALISVTAADAKTADPVFGPVPDWETFRQIGEAGIISRLIDPESARISWLGGIHKGGFKPLLERRVYGYLSCGMVNARNRMGGYTGAQTFLVVIDHDRLLYADIDRSPAGVITEQCTAARRNGLLPPVPVSRAASAIAPPAVTSQGLGLTLRAMPEGAYVSGVAAGSAAALAGLKPGMVIETVNAIPLKNMGASMIKIIEAAGPSASVSIVGGRMMRLGDQP